MTIAVGRLLLGPNLRHRRRLLELLPFRVRRALVAAGIITPRDGGTVRGAADDEAARGPGPDQQREAGGDAKRWHEDEDAEGEPEESKEDAAADGHGGDGEGKGGEEQDGQRGEEEERGCGGLLFLSVI